MIERSGLGSAEIEPAAARRADPGERTAAQTSTDSSNRLLALSHSSPPAPALTPIQRRLLVANTEITLSKPDRADFLHTVMCQVGLPRRRTEARSFERHNGHMSILLEAGKLYNGRAGGFVEMPLPYGVTPRLVMVHVSTEAIRTRCRTVEIGQSMREFLNALGMSTSGGERGGYAALKRQMEALAACRLTLGMQAHGRVITIDSKPIKRFEAWIQPNGGGVDHDGSQPALWPGVLELSQEFYETLSTHAVPLDYRALAALQHSALALDIYTWLAHRLCRVNRAQGVRLSWSNLRDQFGQEYADGRNFKHEFMRALHQVQAVYPEARLGEVIGGLVLYPSHPPLSRTTVAFSQQGSTPSSTRAVNMESIHAESNDA